MNRIPGKIFRKGIVLLLSVLLFCAAAVAVNAAGPVWRPYGASGYEKLADATSLGSFEPKTVPQTIVRFDPYAAFNTAFGQELDPAAFPTAYDQMLMTPDVLARVLLQQTGVSPDSETGDYAPEVLAMAKEQAAAILAAIPKAPYLQNADIFAAFAAAGMPELLTAVDEEGMPLYYFNFIVSSEDDVDFGGLSFYVSSEYSPMLWSKNVLEAAGMLPPVASYISSDVDWMSYMTTEDSTLLPSYRKTPLILDAVGNGIFQNMWYDTSVFNLAYFGHFDIGVAINDPEHNLAKYRNKKITITPVIYPAGADGKPIDESAILPLPSYTLRLGTFSAKANPVFVANCGWTDFESLQDAINYQMKQTTYDGISLIGDTAENVVFPAGCDCTLYLNGYTLRNKTAADTVTVADGADVHISYDNSVFEDQADRKNGKIVNTASGCAAVANNGTLHIESGRYEAAGDGYSVKTGTTGKTHLGFFLGVKPFSYSRYSAEYMAPLYNEGETFINDGYFSFDPTDFINTTGKKPTDCGENGSVNNWYKYGPTKLSNGLWIVTMLPQYAWFRIGEILYEDNWQAFGDAVDGDVVVVLRDAVLPNGAPYSDNKVQASVTLDLNGHTLSCGSNYHDADSFGGVSKALFRILGGAHLTIIGNGALDTSACPDIMGYWIDNGSVTVLGGTYPANTDPSANIPSDGYYTNHNADGTWTVKPITQEAEIIPETDEAASELVIISEDPETEITTEEKKEIVKALNANTAVVKVDSGFDSAINTEKTVIVKDADDKDVALSPVMAALQQQAAEDGKNDISEQILTSALTEENVDMKMRVTFQSSNVKKSADGVSVKSAFFDVKPVAIAQSDAGEVSAIIPREALKKNLTFRLAVLDPNAVEARVWHEDELLGMFPVIKSMEGNYVEISSSDYSTYHYDLYAAGEIRNAVITFTDSDKVVLLAAVDSLAYAEVGFEVNGELMTTETVYESVTVKTADGETTYTPDQFTEDGKYIFALTLDAMPEDGKFTSFAVTMTGERMAIHASTVTE